MKRLVNSWVEAELGGYGNTLAGAIKELSLECGVTLTHSRVSEWRRGLYTPSPKVIAYMLYRVYPWALSKVGITATDAQLDGLEDLVLDMKTVDGDRQPDLEWRTPRIPTQPDLARELSEQCAPAGDKIGSKRWQRV